MKREMTLPQAVLLIVIAVMATEYMGTEAPLWLNLLGSASLLYVLLRVFSYMPPDKK